MYVSVCFNEVSAPVLLFVYTPVEKLAYQVIQSESKPGTPTIMNTIKWVGFFSQFVCILLLHVSALEIHFIASCLCPSYPFHCLTSLLQWYIASWEFIHILFIASCCSDFFSLPRVCSSYLDDHKETTQAVVQLLRVLCSYGKSTSHQKVFAIPFITVAYSVSTLYALR